MQNTKQDQARNLFFQTDLGKTEIAEMLGIPRRTLHHWISANHWDRQKQAAAHMPAFLAENCYHIIARLQEHLMSDERANMPITYREANTIHKLMLTVGKMNSRATLNESLEMMGGFLESVQTNAPAMVPQVIPLVETYIATRSAVTPSQLRSKQVATEFTPVSNEMEEELDRQDILAWQAEGHMSGSNMPHAKPVEKFKPVTINEDRHQTCKARRDSRPDYKDMLAEFRQQDETLKHLFPVNTRKLQAA